MTKLEREIINVIMAQSLKPSVPGTEYDLSPGGLGRVELNTPAEVNALFQSDEFHKGWELCHKHIQERLAYLLSIKNAARQKWYLSGMKR